MAEFTVKGHTFEVEAGSIVVAPAGAVHSFKGAVDGVPAWSISTGG